MYLEVYFLSVLLLLLRSLHTWLWEAQPCSSQGGGGRKRRDEREDAADDLRRIERVRQRLLLLGCLSTASAAKIRRFLSSRMACSWQMVMLMSKWKTT